MPLFCRFEYKSRRFNLPSAVDLLGWAQEMQQSFVALSILLVGLVLSATIYFSTSTGVLSNMSYTSQLAELTARLEDMQRQMVQSKTHTHDQSMRLQTQVEKKVVEMQQALISVNGQIISLAESLSHMNRHVRPYSRIVQLPNHVDLVPFNYV
jgi:hypothetical protein